MTDDEMAGAAPARPSKGQLKRETEALRELAKRLVALPPARLAKLPLADELREAVQEAQGFERGAQGGGEIAGGAAPASRRSRRHARPLGRDRDGLPARGCRALRDGGEHA